MNNLLLKIFTYFLFFPFFFPHYTKADIFTINSITTQNVQDILNLADKDTLVLIDIDYTIVIPKSKMFSSLNSPYLSLIHSLDNDNNYAALSTWYLNRKLQLIENEWIEVIEKLKNKGATVLGFADLDDSWYRLLKDPELIRYKELKELGINFTKTIVDKELFVIETFNNKQAIFYNGILFKGPLTKSETLVKFFKITNFMPSKIIIFDHNELYLNHFNYSLIPLNINYYGFYYKGINKFNNIYPNNNVMNLQWNNLKKNNKWIEDDEAEKLYKQLEASLIK